MNTNEIIKAAMMTLNQKMGTEVHADDYSIQQLKGGGQSLIYKVTSPDGRAFCFKLKRENNTTIHLKRESEFLTTLNSQYFPHLVEDASHEGFIIEEWIEGIHLNLQNRHFLLRNLKNIVQDLSNVLQILGSKEPAILHRDIKPDNLRLCSNHLMVLDFGSAEYEGSREPFHRKSITKLGSQTHLFQPFEQLTSYPAQDRKVDVFAAASLVYAIIEGQPPYDNALRGYNEALANYKQKENEIYQALKPHSSRFGLALFSALRVKPQDRSTDIKEIVIALAEVNFDGAT